MKQTEKKRRIAVLGVFMAIIFALVVVFAVVYMKQSKTDGADSTDSNDTSEQYPDNVDESTGESNGGNGESEVGTGDTEEDEADGEQTHEGTQPARGCLCSQGTRSLSGESQCVDVY